MALLARGFTDRRRRLPGPVVLGPEAMTGLALDVPHVGGGANLPEATWRADAGHVAGKTALVRCLPRLLEGSEGMGVRVFLPPCDVGRMTAGAGLVAEIAVLAQHEPFGNLDLALELGLARVGIDLGLDGRELGSERFVFLELGDLDQERLDL